MTGLLYIEPTPAIHVEPVDWSKITRCRSARYEAETLDDCLLHTSLDPDTYDAVKIEADVAHAKAERLCSLLTARERSFL
jgi:hypothetical protein